MPKVLEKPGGGKKKIKNWGQKWGPKSELPNLFVLPLIFVRVFILLFEALLLHWGIG